MKNDNKDNWDKTWLISKIVSIVIPSILVPLIGYHFTNQFNLNKIEAIRLQNMTEVMKQLTFDDIDSQKKETIALPLVAFKCAAIPTLISFLKDDNITTRVASASALELIGKSSSDFISIFLLNEFVPARFKGEALVVLEKIDLSKYAKTKREFVGRMSKDKFSPDTVINYKTHPFIAAETVLALHRLGNDLNNAYLPSIDLGFINLESIKLNGANLSGVDLRSSTLKHAFFEGANMEGANLDGANITDASFKNAKLKNTILSGVTGFNAENFKGVTGIDDILGRKLIKQQINTD